MSLTVLYARCAGLDVHKLTVVACLLLTAPSGKVSREVRTFTTTTAGLQALAAWLESFGVTHVAMESTGIFWRPVFNLLEGRFEVILVNAQHMKAVPGHKTDIRDSEWIVIMLPYFRGKSFNPAIGLPGLLTTQIKRDIVIYQGVSIPQSGFQAF